MSETRKWVVREVEIVFEVNVDVDNRLVDDVLGGLLKQIEAIDGVIEVRAPEPPGATT